MVKIKLLKTGQLCEKTIQKLIIEWIRTIPEIARFIIHIPNEGRRSYNCLKDLTDMGMRKGVSDLQILIPSRGYHGAFIELKTEVGRLKQEQKLFMQDVSEKGYYADICRSVEEAKKIISWYLKLNQIK